MAAADGADVVNLSLGVVDPVEEFDPFKTVTDGLVEQGIAVFASAGNDGFFGLYEPSSPGIGSSVFSVGSTDNSKFPTTYTLKDSNGRSLWYSAILPLDSPQDGLTVQVMGFGSELYDDMEGCWLDNYEAAVADMEAEGIGKWCSPD